VSLQDVVVCAHFGCAFVPALVERLSDAERRALLAVDARAFRADADRRHRAVVAIADELPVSIAVAGLDAVYALFDDEGVFGRVVAGADVLAVAFADALVGTVGDAARIEGAVARARRRRRVRRVIARTDGVEAVRVSEGALAAFDALRARLGTDVVAAVCSGARLTTAPGNSNESYVLATRDPAGGVALGACSSALGALLVGLDGVDDIAGATALARSLGCDTDAEALELLRELAADGLVSLPAV